VPSKRPADPAASSPKPVAATTATCKDHADKAADLCSGKGLSDPDVIGDFVTDFKSKVVKDWDKMTEDQRYAAVKALQEEQFKKLGIPAPTIAKSTDAAAGYDDPVTLFGMAKATDDSMTFNGNLFKKSPLSEHDQKELAKTMMHEGRHIEQYYKIAQYRAANGDTADDIATKDTDTHKPVDLPKDVIEKAAKNPLPSKVSGSGADCPNFAKAKEWNDAKYGKGDLSQYRPEVDYMDRPLEKDAWGLEPAVDAKW